MRWRQVAESVRLPPVGLISRTRRAGGAVLGDQAEPLDEVGLRDQAELRDHAMVPDLAADARRATLPGQAVVRVQFARPRQRPRPGQAVPPDRAVALGQCGASETHATARAQTRATADTVGRFLVVTCDVRPADTVCGGSGSHRRARILPDGAYLLA